MSQAINFMQNSLLLGMNEEGVVGEFQYLFAPAGSCLLREYLFCDKFCGCSFIKVIALPDFDMNDQESLEQAMSEYDANPDQYNASSYELARIVH